MKKVATNKKCIHSTMYIGSICIIKCFGMPNEKEYMKYGRAISIWIDS